MKRAFSAKQPATVVASYGVGASPQGPTMLTSLETLQSEVMRLSPSDRSRLLERLIVSLDSDSEVEAAWDAVADARENEATSGAATVISLEEALVRLEARFRG